MSLGLAVAACDGNRDGGVAALLNPEPTPSAVMPEAAPPAAAAPQAAAELARLRDLRATQVQALVGSPDFRRVEPPAELWQYRTADCVVDLFFYGDDDDRRVVRADARSRDPSRVGEEQCGDGNEVLKSRLRG